jgi:uncharacterized protein DUF6644
MSLLNFCTWVEGTPIGLFVRESLWGFPTLVAIHIMGLAVSAGMVVWFDLRLLGWSMRGSPVSMVYRQLMPWAFGGFFVMFVTGSLLLTGAAVAAYGNLYFRVKASALVLAGVNALVYHTVTERGIRDWNEAARPPLPARMAGLISVVLWGTVILAGRMMSYTLYSH